MLKIHFNPNTDEGALPDGEVLAYAKRQCELALSRPDVDLQLEIGQELLVEAFRICIKRGIIPCDQVRLTWIQDGILNETIFNKDGRSENYPPSTLEDFLSELSNWLWEEKK